MDNKQIMISTQNINDIKEELSTYINQNIILDEIVGTSKKAPKISQHKGKLVSISRNLFNIEQTIGSYKIIKSFQLNDILIGKITIRTANSNE